MSRTLFLISVCILLSPSLSQAQPLTPAQQMQRWVDDQTIMIGMVDVNKVNIAASITKFTELMGPLARQSGDANRAYIKMKDDFTQAGGERIFFTYSALDLDGPPLLIVPLQNQQRVDDMTKVLDKFFPHPKSTFIDGYLLIGSAAAVDARSQLKPVARPQLLDAQKSNSTAAIQIYLIPSADARKVVAELLPTLPKELGEGSTKFLTEGLQWGLFTLDLPPKLSGQARVQASSPEHAQTMANLWKKFLTMIDQSANMTNDLVNTTFWKVAHQLLSSLELSIKDNQLSMQATAEKLEPLTAAMAKTIAQNAGAEINAANLRQIAIAMHNFHGDFKRLPNQAMLSKDNKPLLSWRVALLPYLGEDLLYKDFKFDESWDSEHNKKLIPRMPKIYVHPFAKNVPEHHTLYQVFYSKQGAKPAAMFMETGRITLGMLTVQDGTSNTFMATDAASEAVPWTKPADLLYDGTVQNLPKLVSPRGNNWAHAAFGDGSVRMFKVNADPKYIWQLIGRNDGEPIDFDKVIAK